MSHHVKLVNNPYLQRLSILIDGKNIPAYSSLHQYAGAPFIEWCDDILDEIARQLNGDSFSLTFSSSAEEMFIMQSLTESHPLCDVCVCVPLVRDTSTAERLKMLHDLIRDGKLRNYKFQKLSALFVLSDELKPLRRDLLGLQVKNSFCELLPEIVSPKEFSQAGNQPHDVTFIISSKELSSERVAQRIQGDSFAIQISNAASEQLTFLAKSDGIFLWQARTDFLVQAIFKCLLLTTLIQALRRCIASFPNELKNRYRSSLEEIQSISNKIIPVVESNVIEEGRSIQIRFDTDIATRPVSLSDLSYSYSHGGVIRCNGLLVEGLHGGKCVLYIHRVGESVPCAEVSFTVAKRNRIEKITFIDKLIILGEGSQYGVRFSVEPMDADNLNKITWSTTDSQVATVDNGLLHAKKHGICNIICTAENVSAKLQCVVKPYLAAIVAEEERIEIACGDKKVLNIRGIPEDAIDSQLLISSMDMRVAHVVGNEVHGVDKGSTRLVVENESRTLRTEIIVRVTRSLFSTIKKKFFGG